MLYPLPAVMVSVTDGCGNDNIITIAWTGTVCTNPPMVSISVRKSRYSYEMLKNTGEFVINLVTKDLVRATDYCGVRSGIEVDKFQQMHLTAAPSVKVKAPSIEESPVNIECKVVEIRELGSHDMFLAEVVSVSIEDKYMDENGKFELNSTGLVTYSHGEYFELGKKLGTFGYSVRKKTAKKKSKTKNKKK